MERLADTWKSMNRHDSALQLMTECLELRVTHLGPDHRDTLRTKDILTEWHELEDGEQNTFITPVSSSSSGSSPESVLKRCSLEAHQTPETRYLLTPFLLPIDTHQLLDGQVSFFLVCPSPCC
ncbi:hypothetical protein BDW59DRAFT_92006 [Aspergillus cavernicola]|uniref:Kinesin light chain n=1 Tax=Aspergillus cavernicola TaxID=176166 RepID=A0ABR4I7P8_9EURO